MTERHYVWNRLHDNICRKNKKEWKGREYKNLQGKGHGWSFPIEMKNMIEKSLEADEEEEESTRIVDGMELVDVMSVVDTATVMNVLESAEIDSQDVGQSRNDDENSKEGGGLESPSRNIKRTYHWNIDRELYEYLETFIR